MAEKRPRTGFDSELDLRAIIYSGLGIVLVTAVILALLFPLLEVFRRERAALDPAPSPMPEAQHPRLPPEPRLQAEPRLDMEKLRARDEAALQSYGWVDRAAGIGRIPIERAIEILAETDRRIMKVAPRRKRR